MSDLSDAQLADMEAKARVSMEQDEAWHMPEDLERWAEAVDAEFIAAANPTTILALLNRVRQAEAKLARVQELHEFDDGYCKSCAIPFHECEVAMNLLALDSEENEEHER